VFRGQAQSNNRHGERPDKIVETENGSMTSQEKRTLVVKFRIEGNLRFLSHQETMTMWSRVLARSGLDVCFSSGFNPHPRISLPLPRSVGVRSDDELLCAQVWTQSGSVASDTAGSIQSCLPDGCIVTEVEIHAGKRCYGASSVTYEFAVASGISEKGLERVLALNATAGGGQALMVRRQPKGNAAWREIDVGAYLVSALVTGDSITVVCRVTPAGTVRVDEIMQLLGLETQDIVGGVLRKSVQWERN